MTLIVVLEIVDYGLQLSGSDAPGILKLPYLLPFLWLLLESKKRVQSNTPSPAAA
jgi:hypothetical protein